MTHFGGMLPDSQRYNQLQDRRSHSTRGLNSDIKVNLCQWIMNGRSKWSFWWDAARTTKDPYNQLQGCRSHSTWELKLDVKMNLGQWSMKSGLKWPTYSGMVQDKKNKNKKKTIHTSSCKMVCHIVPEN